MWKKPRPAEIGAALLPFIISQLFQRHHRYLYRLEFCRIDDPSVVIEVIDSRVGHEVELVVEDGPCRRITNQLRPLFESLAGYDPTTVWSKLPMHHARLSNSGLHAHETAFVPIQAIDSCESIVRLRSHLLHRGRTQIESEDPQHVRNVKYVAIG